VADAPHVAGFLARGLRRRLGRARRGPGPGRVSLEGSGDDARAQVNFGPAGVKWLALSVAKLEPVG